MITFISSALLAERRSAADLNGIGLKAARINASVAGTLSPQALKQMRQQQQSKAVSNGGR